MPAASPQEERLRFVIGANVRRLRNKRGLTVEDAAHEGDIHGRHWQKIESGEVGLTLDMVGRLAAALEVDPLELFRPLD